MRADLALSLPDTAVITRGTFVSDGGGGGTVDYKPAGTFDCRIAPLTAPENPEGVQGGRINPEAQFVVTLPAETEVTTEDRIEVDSTTYSVEALRSPRSYESSTRIEVREIV